MIDTNCHAFQYTVMTACPCALLFAFTTVKPNKEFTPKWFVIEIWPPVWLGGLDGKVRPVINVQLPMRVAVSAPVESKPRLFAYELKPTNEFFFGFSVVNAAREISAPAQHCKP